MTISIFAAGIFVGVLATVLSEIVYTISAVVYFTLKESKKSEE